MANNQYDRSTLEARIARAEAGSYLSSLRKSAEMTQKDLAEALDLKYYTFISQVENGQGRLPPYLWVKTANALKTNVKEFSLSMLRFYDPHAFMAVTDGTLWKDTKKDEVI